MKIKFGEISFRGEIINLFIKFDGQNKSAEGQI